MTEEKEIKERIESSYCKGFLQGAILTGIIFGSGMFRVAKDKDRKLEAKIDEMTPKIRIEQTMGNKTPERFYEIGGKRVYLEIDGKPVEQYFSDRKSD